jgi:hypothetical protein
MPLIKCPDCQTEMSDAADKCPKCGRPNTIAAKKKGTSTRDAGCLLMVLALFGSFVVPGAVQGMMWLLLVVGLVIAVLGMVKK